MADRFIVMNRPGAHLNRSRHLHDGTGPRTLGTRLVIAEAFELDLEYFLNSPLSDGFADLDGQGFDGVEVKVESRPFLAVSAPRDNFPPTLRHVANIGQILRLALGERHGVAVLELAIQRKLGISY